MEAEGWCLWFPLPAAQRAVKSIARVTSCPAQPSEHYYFINLMSSPPQLIQLQYCRNNFLQLLEEVRTSEARRALPSPPCSQWAAIPKAASRFAKSLIPFSSSSQGCMKSSSHEKKTTTSYYHQTLQNPRATEQGLDEEVTSPSQTRKCHIASADAGGCCQASGVVDHSPFSLCTRLPRMLGLLLPRVTTCTACCSLCLCHPSTVVPLALIQEGAFMGC